MYVTIPYQNPLTGHQLRPGHGLNPQKDRPGSEAAGCGGGSPGGPRGEEGRLSKEKEKEEEEEGKRAHDPRQELERPIWNNRPRSQRGDTTKVATEGQEARPPDSQQEELVREQLEQLFERELNRGGWPARGAVHASLGAPAYLEEISRSSYIMHDTRGTKGNDVTTGCRTSRSRGPDLAAIGQPILQTTFDGRYGATCGPRSVALVSCARPDVRGSSRQCHGLSLDIMFPMDPQRSTYIPRRYLGPPSLHK